MPNMEFDFDGLIRLLANNLYSEKSVFIRELIQNAHDSIVRRRHYEGRDFGGRIDINTRPADLILEVVDNGIGMNDDDLRHYLSTIGKGRTFEERGTIEGLIGQFGIGFLSAFVVARRVEVRTRKARESQGWLWVNEGKRDYALTPCDRQGSGTTVTVHLTGEEHRALIREEAMQGYIRRYADLLRVPIHLNGGDNPVNTMIMS